MSTSGETVFLDDCWTLYFHDPDDPLWTVNSYKQIGNISTVDEFIHANNTFTDMWSKGMFFLMREHIQPLWEDPYNKNGGCFSYKVNKPDVPAVWFRLASLALGNNLGKSAEKDLQDSICGVSISPKRSYCIMRIWIGNVAYNKPSLFNIDAPDYTHVLFKNHEENNDFAVESAK